MLLASDRGRWKTVTPSQYAWEQEALDYLKDRLGGRILRAWTNFEFIASSGAIYEVDALVLSPAGLFLVEIKSWPGTLTGDTHTWIVKRGSSTKVLDNPVFLANQKAKAIKSLLGQQRAVRSSHDAVLPYVEPVVFLSSPTLDFQLSEGARHHVFIRNELAPPGLSVLDALTLPEGAAANARGRRIDKRIEGMVAQAVEQAGIRPPHRSVRVGDYLLGDLVYAGPDYQDRRAEHASLKTLRRLRQYLVPPTASAYERERVWRAARRDFLMVDSVRHPGIIRARDFVEHERGPALIFDDAPEAMRLDHYLRTHGDQLDQWTRLQMLRQIAEALRHAHGLKLLHRSLSPQSILVYAPPPAPPELGIMNWQTATHESGSTGTVHIRELVESAATVYVAPELLASPDHVGEYSDVFSLGTVAFFLLSGKPPAASLQEQQERLRELRGLRLSSALDGVVAELDSLVHMSTHPEALERIATVDDFLTVLDTVEDRLTAPLPPAEAFVDPLDAVRGQRLQHGLLVEGTLGRGSVSRALLVRRGNEELVLKVAHSLEDNEALEQEAEVLLKVRDRNVVESCGLLDFGPRRGLLLKRAGEKTLAQHLREEGPLHLEWLQRFGDQLLGIVAHLEAKGIPHRDIKPANLGIGRPASHAEGLSLVLFDFSLSRTPPEHIRAGTPGYLDPFLSERRPQRWDLHAERYAAAATLYEMATGVLPRWGDGVSDPALTPAASLQLEPERFDAGLRDALRAFFERGLHRDPRRRFDNAKEMRAAWNEVFSERPAVVAEPAPEEPDDERPAAPSAELDAPIPSLLLGAAAEQVLDRMGIFTVRDLLARPLSDVIALRGVGSRTRRRIAETIKLLQRQFPAAALKERLRSTPARGRKGEPAPQPGAWEAESVDVLAIHVLRPDPKGRVTAASRLRMLFLGVDETLRDLPQPWLGAEEIAQRAGGTVREVRTRLEKLRVEWAAEERLLNVRDALGDLVRDAGGVATVASLAEGLLTVRGSAMQTVDLRGVLARAVVRAAVEAEATAKAPRFVPRRDDNRVLVAFTPLLADFALQIGRKADDLAAADPLATPQRALQELRESWPADAAVAAPEEAKGLPDHRLLRLAATMSRSAAVSTRGELYPRGMEADRAVRLSHGSLLFDARPGGDEAVLTEGEVRERVASRYPEAAPLPPRPALDDLLDRAGTMLVWDDGKSGYKRRTVEGIDTKGSTQFTRASSWGHRRTALLSPEAAEGQAFDERLRHALEAGSFLSLTVRPRYFEEAQAHLLETFGLGRVSVDALLIESMRTHAEELEVQWDVVLSADTAQNGQDSQDWTNLLRLARMAAADLDARVLAAKQPTMLVHLGLLARYELMELVEGWRDTSGRSDGPPAIWLLHPAPEQELPVIDGIAVPLLNRSQHARVPEAWLGYRPKRDDDAASA